VCLITRLGLAGEKQAASREAMEEYARLFHNPLSRHQVAVLAEAFGWALPVLPHDTRSSQGRALLRPSAGKGFVCWVVLYWILIWNVRGPNRKSRRDAVTSVVSSSRLGLALCVCKKPKRKLFRGEW
jgi:hypothetical protein